MMSNGSKYSMHGSYGLFGCQDTNTWRFDLYTRKKHVLHIYIYIYSVYSYIFYDMFPFEPPKNHGWLGYIGDYATQLYGDYS